MAVFRADDRFPDWCELRHFGLIELGQGEEVTLNRRHEKELIVSVQNTGQVASASGSLALAEGQFFAIPAADPAFTLRAHGRAAGFMRLSGIWGNEIAGCGVFRVAPGDGPKNIGDPVTYPKLTGVDSHYHDYDEYWIVLEGSGIVRIGGESLPVRRGDCVATGQGHHHDIPQVHGLFRAVYLETTLCGAKRIGHLWNHSHGPAQPDPAKI